MGSLYVKKSSLAKLKNKDRKNTQESQTLFVVIVAGAGAGRRHHRRVVYL